MAKCPQDKIVFCLGFSIARSNFTLSQWVPGSFDKGMESLELFADVRLQGFAGLLSSGMAKKIVIVSGQWKEDSSISQATVIKEMLVKDFYVPEHQVEAIPSVGNTKGNIDKIQGYIEQHDLLLQDCAVCTNLYHIPRALTDLAEADLLMQPICAESVWLAAKSKLVWAPMLSTLRLKFGDSPLTTRMVQEIRGIADKYQGSYISSGHMTD